jgi:ketosteroid isomerase-like protein
MTQEASIEELFRAIDCQNWGKLSSIFHPDITYERPGYQPFIGIDQVLQFYANERMISSGQHKIEHIMVDHNCGVCWGHFVGILKDGTKADERFVDVYQFYQNSIIERRSYFFRPAI